MSHKDACFTSTKLLINKLQAYWRITSEFFFSISCFYPVCNQLKGAELINNILIILDHLNEFFLNIWAGSEDKLPQFHVHCCLTVSFYLFVYIPHDLLPFTATLAPDLVSVWFRIKFSAYVVKIKIQTWKPYS